jgi:serine/threonine protein kinase
MSIGKTLGHYRVGEQLGRGGMGEVYLADDLNLNRKVALKFLPDAFAGDPERMVRFEREAKLRIAFLARSTDGKDLLWVRSLDTLTAQPLATCSYASPACRASA